MLAMRRMKDAMGTEEFETLSTVLANETGVADMATLTYAQLDTYIDNNVTDLASAKIFLKRLSKVVFFILRQEYL